MLAPVWPRLHPRSAARQELMGPARPFTEKRSSISVREAVESGQRIQAQKRIR